MAWLRAASSLVPSLVSWLNAIHTAQGFSGFHQQPAQFTTLHSTTSPSLHLDVPQSPKFLMSRTGRIIFTLSLLPICIVSLKKCISFQQGQERLPTFFAHLYPPLKHNPNQILLEATAKHLQ